MAVLDCIYDSEVLGGKTAMRVILPDDVPVTSAPVFYLLHGLDGNYMSWYQNTDLVPLCEKYGVCFVMPDAKNSYYTNTISGERYYTQISDELIQRVSQYFGLGGERHIAGISMGGHGAYKIALKKPEMFATAASLSGVLDLKEVLDDPIEERKCKTLSEAIGNAEISGSENDLFYLLQNASGTMPRFYQFCGREDFLYNLNRRFRDFARSVRIDLTYLEDSGDHTWPVWAKQIEHYVPWAIGAQF